MVPAITGGPDADNNVVSICSPCHARVHELGVRRGNMRELQKIGIERAKKAGKYQGRHPPARAKAKEVAEMLTLGNTRAHIAETLGISIASIYRIQRDIAETIHSPY